MIDLKRLQATYKKQFEPRFAGGKYYIAVLSGNGYAQRARRIFKRASEAQIYADRLLKVWRRVYPIFERLAISDQLSAQVEPTPALEPRVQ
jgi:hypothetical protein